MKQKPCPHCGVAIRQNRPDGRCAGCGKPLRSTWGRLVEIWKKLLGFGPNSHESQPPDAVVEATLRQAPSAPAEGHPNASDSERQKDQQRREPAATNEPVVVKWLIGAGHRDKGEYEQAIAVQNELIQLHPEWPMVYFERGLTYLVMGDEDRAIADFTETIRLDPTRLDPACAETYRRRANLYNKKGAYDKAIGDLNESIRSDPDCAESYFERGYAYLFERDFHQAIADYTQAIRLQPIAKSYIFRATAYDGLGEFDKAIADCSEAIRLDQDCGPAYVVRGNLDLKVGDYERAIADWSEVIRLNQEDAKAYEERAKAYRAVGDLAKAFSDELKAQQMHE